MAWPGFTVCLYPAGKQEGLNKTLTNEFCSLFYYRLQLCGLLPPLEYVHPAADEAGHQQEAARHAEADLVVGRGLEYPA